MRRKILVADDSQDTLNILEAVLKRGGFKAQVVSNGEDALKKIKEDPPDLVLLDIMMPKMDGLEVCRILKGDSRWRHIPIFMFSARDDPAARQRALRLGASAFIEKPIYPREILRKIRLHFGESDRNKSSDSSFGRFSYGLGT